MKKIAINGKFLSQKLTGVQRVALELIKELDLLVPKGVFEIIVPVQCKTNILPIFKNIKIVRYGKLNGILWEQISYPLYAVRNHATTLNLCNSRPILAPGYVYIYDLIFEYPGAVTPGYKRWHQLMNALTVRRIIHVFTISEYSKEQILKKYRNLEDKISITSLGWQHFETVEPENEALEKYNLVKKEYYFFLGTVAKLKNIPWILEVAKRNPNEVFVISGNVKNSVHGTIDPSAFELPNVKLLGYLSDGEVKTLMENCKAFLWPSFIEGFGLPPLEALSAGARVIASNTSSMPEVLGNSVHFINPNKYDYELDELLSEHVENPEEVLRKYSWAKGAEEMFLVLQKDL